MTCLPKVINVIAHDDYTLTLTFDNYEVKLFDMIPYIENGHEVFRELTQLTLFRTVVPWCGTIQWCHEQDLCPDMLYVDSIYTSNTLPRIIKVVANDNYTLTLTFNNNEIKVFDMMPYIDKKFIGFENLIDLQLFTTVRLWYGRIQWDNEQYIRPDTCYLDSTPTMC